MTTRDERASSEGAKRAEVGTATGLSLASFEDLRTQLGEFGPSKDIAVRMMRALGEAASKLERSVADFSLVVTEAVGEPGRVQCNFRLEMTTKDRIKWEPNLLQQFVQRYPDPAKAPISDSPLPVIISNSLYEDGVHFVGDILDVRLASSAAHGRKMTPQRWEKVQDLVAQYGFKLEEYDFYFSYERMKPTSP